jgi:peroxiredoxin
MKLFFVILLSASFAGAFAQKTTLKKDSSTHSVSSAFTIPANTKYQLPDGKIVDEAGFDSVRKVWGNKYSMGHDSAHPWIISVFPVTAATEKEAADARAKTEMLLNKPAPEFTLKDIYGKTYDLHQLKGKVVVLNFWFIGCAPCLAEMPELNKVRNTYDHSKVVFLSLGLDGATAIRKFLKVNPFDYTPLTNAGTVHKSYNVASCPTSMVLDKNGIIRSIQISGLDISTMLPAAIKSVLE